MILLAASDPQLAILASIVVGSIGPYSGLRLSDRSADLMWSRDVAYLAVVLEGKKSGWQDGDVRADRLMLVNFSLQEI